MLLASHMLLSGLGTLNTVRSVLNIMLVLGVLHHLETTKNWKYLPKINNDRRFLIDEISEQIRVSWSFCQRILTEDLQIRHFAVNFISRPLAQDRKIIRLSLIQDLKNQIQRHTNFFTEVITGDESLRWQISLCFDDVEAVKRASQWTLDDILKSSRGALNIGKEDWSSALILMESALKVTEIILKKTFWSLPFKTY